MLTRIAGKRARRMMAWLMLGSVGMSAITGCSRQFWRQQADRDTYSAVTEKLNDPHWQVPRIDLTPDPRSRFYDPYDPDCQPLPPDDPAAHEFMHCVNGKRGYKSWHKLGTALSIENPHWLEPFGVAVQNADPVIGHSQVQLLKVTLPDSVELAYIHNRDYQSTIEDLYLSALQLTLERYSLGVRFLGTNGTEPGAGLATRTNATGVTSGTLNSNFGVSQALTSGGQIAVELANQTLWVFGSPGNSATSLSYSLTQPLLFGAGRKIALEALTQAERDVLYNARTLARFRQTLFAEVARSYLGLLLQRQSILNRENNLRQLGEQLEAQEAQDSRKPKLLNEILIRFPEGVQIPDGLKNNLKFDRGTLTWTGAMTETQQQDLLSLSDDEAYQAAVQQMIAFQQGSVVSLSAAQLKTNYNSTQNQLENSRRQYADQLDAFKLLLGLPPNVQLEIDETLLRPFELISRRLIDTEKVFRDLQLSRGLELLPEGGVGEDGELDTALLREYVKELIAARDELYNVGLKQVESDFEPVRQVLEFTADDWSASDAGRRYFSTEAERERVMADLERDLRLYRMSERDFALASSVLDSIKRLTEGATKESIVGKLDTNGNGLIEPTELPEEWQYLQNPGRGELKGSFSPDDIVQLIRDGAFSLREAFLRTAQSLQVVQAGLRVEAIALNRFSLTPGAELPDIEEVVRIGLEQRHDLMNARAEVMDARRQVEIAANALEAGLDIRIQGDQNLGGGSGSSNYRAGIAFTTPLDQINERNSYNTTLVNYQRARRRYMLLEDQVKQNIRQAWRQITVQQKRIEVDRQTVRIAALQYDNASLAALGANQTNALNLLNALNSVLNAQDGLIGDWVTYENNRLNVFRDMGIMEIDRRGVWIDGFYQQMDGVQSSEILEGSMINPPNSTSEIIVPPLPEPINQ